MLKTAQLIISSTTGQIYTVILGVFFFFLSTPIYFLIYEIFSAYKIIYVICMLQSITTNPVKSLFWSIALSIPMCLLWSPKFVCPNPQSNAISEVGPLGDD